MKVLITGAAGYIGNAVAKRLVADGCVVYGLLRSDKRAAELHREEIIPVIGNLDNPQSYKPALDECEAVVHCAAEYTERFFELDRSLVETVLSSRHHAPGRRLFIYTSGVWVYGNRGSELIDEMSHLRPPAMVAPRAEIERRVIEGDGPGWRTFVVRPGCVYGGRGSLTAEWFQSAQDKKFSEIVGEGLNYWAMVHLQDLCDLYSKVLSSALSGEILNAASGRRVSIYECAKAASLAAGGEGRVMCLPMKDATAKYGAMAECLAFDQNVDSSKATRLLGWTAKQPDFAQGADRFYRAWKNSAC